MDVLLIVYGGKIGHPFSQPRYLWMSSLLFMGVLFITGAGVPGPPLTRIDFKFRAGKQRRKNRTPIFSTEIFMDVLLFAFMGVLFIPGAGVPGPPLTRIDFKLRAGKQRRKNGRGKMGHPFSQPRYLWVSSFFFYYPPPFFSANFPENR